MKKVFLDTNILLDIVFHREKEDYAIEIFSLAEKGEFEICASALSYANIAYTARKYPPAQICQTIKDLSEGVEIIPLDNSILIAAANNPCRDFEDMLQYQCALSAQSDVLVTNNKKDFVHFSKLPLKTSEEFIEEWRKL